MENVKEMRKLSIQHHLLNAVSILVSIVGIFAISTFTLIGYVVAAVSLVAVVVMTICMFKVKSKFRNILEAEMKVLVSNFIKSYYYQPKSFRIKRLGGLRYRVRVYDSIGSTASTLLNAIKVLTKASWMQVKVTVCEGNMKDLLSDVFAN